MEILFIEAEVSQGTLSINSLLAEYVLRPMKNFKVCVAGTIFRTLLCAHSRLVAKILNLKGSFLCLPL